MTTEQFRATLHQQPFRPFTIRMADGRAFEVAHRDLIAMSPLGRTVIVYESDEKSSILDLLLMSEPQVPAGNDQLFLTVRNRMPLRGPLRAMRRGHRIK